MPGCYLSSMIRPFGFGAVLLGILSAEKSRHDKDLKFKSWDKNGDEVLDIEEFRQIKKVQRLEPQVIEKIFARLDEDKNQKISKKELRFSVIKHKDIEKLTQRLFARWDSNQDEKIDQGEFEKLPKRFRQVGFSSFDTDGDKSISMQEMRAYGKANPPKRRPQWTYAFRRMDANKDRQLELTELQAAVDADEKNRWAKRWLKKFETLDANSDGKLHPKEIDPNFKGRGKKEHL